MSRVLVALALASLLAACSTPATQPPEAAGPTLGKADGADQADQGCVVVLRRARMVTEYLMGAGGPPSDYWELTVDVDAAYTSVREVGVLYRTNLTAGKWYALAPEDHAAAGGFVTYRFELRHFVAAGASTTIDLIPYVRTAGGQRLFDHNRVADLSDAYHLDAENEWTIAADAAVCPDQAASTPHYILSYPADETLEAGPVTGGGHLKVTYDGRRLRETAQCMGAQGSVSATTIRMFYAFDGATDRPSDVTVEEYTVAYGQGCPESPCVTQRITEPLIAVPAGARSLALWFACVPGFSHGAPDNWQYDSNDGRNYVLPVD